MRTNKVRVSSLSMTLFQQANYPLSNAVLSSAFRAYNRFQCFPAEASMNNSAKIAPVTGGSRGTGRATVEALA